MHAGINDTLSENITVETVAAAEELVAVQQKAANDLDSMYGFLPVY